MMRRAIQAAGEAQRTGNGFDDEIARAVIESLWQASDEVLAAGSADPGWPGKPGLHMDWRWKRMIDTILER